jgi:predicted metalloprotease
MVNLRILRKYHRLIAPILFLPLLVTVITGVVFDMADENLLKVSDSIKETIISIHKGGYLGEKLSILYVLLNGLGVLVMLLTGIAMLKNINRSKSFSE